ncbi:protein ITPRID2 [Epinephelus fuscoguttatus]|uniref:protein ITPRID2 n=1 Tax=Epinephelus fuscoguttatus TaxID=293821 RepID=UPI0020D1E883|nr:protein ITPRID2 [Epinephelus fuscoguttatus]XP_049447704.1 protein ITPRID2 [Epinephelus fuscoguttatus]
MDSPSPTERRQAWINSCRRSPTLEEQMCSLRSASIADDDVFSDGCYTEKIESWFLGCGSEACSEKTGQLSLESALKVGNFDDELSLGADASLFSGGEITTPTGFVQHPFSNEGLSTLTSTPRQGLYLPSLNLGHSMASSCLSSSTCKTTSSISEVLQMCSEDAEETLYELGFGCDEPQVTVRIPPRFFTFPSMTQGINFRLFLDSQIRRIREEDPSLSLASRFRQVQVLTAMANAFYSLYSHVSRTPLQKLATPEFTFSSSPVERFERFRGSVRSEPRSPVERLKDTVSKMCLYTGSPRGSDSTSPQPSPSKRSSLPDVVDVVLDKVKTGVTKKLQMGEYNTSNSAVDDRLIMDGDKLCNSGRGEQTQQAVADTDILRSGDKICQEMQGSKQTENVDADEKAVKPADLEGRTESMRTSLASSLSGETVIETDRQCLSTHCDTRNADLKPAAKVTYDVISPQIVESVHQAPFCCQHTHCPKAKDLPPISPETESIDRSHPGSHEPETQTPISEPDGRQLDASRPLPVLAPSGSYTQCCITVTGWDGKDVSSCHSITPGSGLTSIATPVQTCEESFIEGKRRYLNPLIHRGLGHDSNNLQQVNSFELEEVHSAGEEDFGTTTSPLSRKRRYKGEMARGDSVQSDSSGYAEEEVSPASNMTSR